MNHSFSFKTELGFVLMLIGVQLGTAIRNIFYVELVNVLMILSLFLVCNYKNFFHFHFPSWNIYFKWIVFFNLVEVLYLSFQPTLVSIFLQYHLYQIFAIILLSTQNKNLSINNLPTILLISSAIIALVVGYQSTNGFTGIYTENVFYNEETDSSGLSKGGDKITMGRALLLCIVTCIVLFFKKKCYPLICFCLIVLSFIGLFMFGTRASMVCAFICLLVYIGKKYGFSVFVSRKNCIVLGLIVFCIIGSYFLFPFIHERIDTYAEGTLRGIYTMLGSHKYGVDPSTITRYYTLNKAMSFWNDGNFTIIKMLFGNGYFPFYIDVPIVQAFYDFGCFGFIYFFIMICLPIKYIAKKTNESAILIIQLFAIHYLLDQFYCALPYYHFQFIPLILLLFFQKNNRKNFV